MGELDHSSAQTVGLGRWLCAYDRSFYSNYYCRYPRNFLNL